MTQPINLSKSIRQNRLHYKPTPGYVLDLVLKYIAVVILLACATLPLILKPINASNITIWHIFFTFTFDSYLLLSLLLLDRLVKIKGTDLYHNRKNIEEVLNCYFSNLIPEDCGKGVVRYIKPSGTSTWGRMITVLLDNDQVYLNITTLGRANSASVFHGLINYIKCRQIKKKFKQIQLIHATT